MTTFPPYIHISPVKWDLRYPEYEMEHSVNGIQVYSMDSSPHQIAYVELVFENGRLAESKKLTSRMCANQLLEGSSEQTRAEIAEFFDYYGCSYQVHSDLDFTIIALNTLDKHFERVFAYLIRQITKASFTSENLQKGKKSLLSQLEHQLAEPDFVSYREFSSSIYGSESTYGYNSSEELINNILPQDLQNYFEESYTADILKIFYCGKKKPSSFWMTHLEAFRKDSRKLPEYQFFHHDPVRKHFPIQNCAQRSLKMGLRIFKKSDMDYFPMYFINTILGDYFGSRLMSEVREKHGLTYDIGSTLDSQLHDGLFYISAELNPNQTENSIEIIKNEIQKLQEYKMKNSELEMVRNYLNGHIQRQIDGPYQSILLLKILVTEFKRIDAFESLLETIKSIDQRTIREKTTQYLDINKMTIITAGA